MKKYNLTKVTLACLLSALGSTAFAGGPAPFYIGATAGQANVDNNLNGFDNDHICSDAGKNYEECRIGDGGSAGHIYGGFQLNDNFAVEIGYADLGDTAAYHYTDPATITQETKGVTVAAVGRYRLGKSSRMLAYGKAGVFAWNSEVTSESDNHRIPHGSTDDSGVDPMIGAGLEYELSHNVSIRAGWDRYYGVGSNDVLVDFHDGYETGELNTLDTDVDVYSAGVNFSFL
jgi:OOP family OmpA-OmpF porin